MNDSMPPAGNVQDQVNGPAIGLMATAGIGAAFQIFGILMAMGLMGLNMSNSAFGGSSGMGAMMAGAMGMVIRVIALGMSVVVFMGASKMKNLQSHGFAMAAAIIACVPCISPCCCLGLPFGIWAIVVLMKPEVKAAFQG